MAPIGPYEVAPLGGVALVEKVLLEEVCHREKETEDSETQAISRAAQSLSAACRPRWRTLSSFPSTISACHASHHDYYYKGLTL